MLEKEIDEVRKKQLKWSYATTDYDRLDKTMNRFQEIFKDKQKIVVHLIGVGNKGGPQVEKMIDTLGQNKELEVHVIDQNTSLLKHAEKNLSKKYPQTKIFFHQGDIVNPKTMENLKPADLSICTNVLMYINSPTKQVALNNIANKIKKNGFLMTDSLIDEIESEDHGLTKKEEVIEKLSVFKNIVNLSGIIFQKTSEPKTLKEIWGKAKKQKP